MPSSSLIHSIIIFTTCFIVHWVGSRNNGLTFDDKHTLLQNPIVKSSNIPSFKALMTSDYWGSKLDQHSHQSFRPVTTISFWIDAGGNPSSLSSAKRLHTTNIIIHSINSVLIGKIASKHGATKNYSILASLYFAVHPVLTESIANISGRAELLGCLFGLSYYLLLTSTSLNLKTYTLFIVGIILSLLSTFSKESGFASTVIVIIYFWTKWKTYQSDDAKIKFFVATTIAGIVGSARVQFLKTSILGTTTSSTAPLFNSIDNPLTNQSLSFKSLVLSTGHTNVINLRLLFNPLPSSLCPDYSGKGCPIIDEIQDVKNLSTLLAIVFIIVILFFIFYWGQNIGKGSNVNFNHYIASVVALCWWCIPMSIASNIFVHVGFCIAERTLYSPLVGVVLLIFTKVLPCAAGRWRYVSSSRNIQWIFGIFGIILFVAMTTRTIKREKNWSSNFQLWSSAEKECKQVTSRILNNLGKAYQRMGHTEPAKKYLNRAIDLNPFSNLPHFNLGMMDQKEKNCPSALEHYRRSIILNPYHSASYNNAAVCALQLGERVKALNYFKKASELNSDGGTRRKLKVTKMGKK
jgi:hypothetical protein